MVLGRWHADASCFNTHSKHSPSTRETADAICRGPLSGATLVGSRGKKGERKKKEVRRKEIKNNLYERATEMGALSRRSMEIGMRADHRSSSSFSSSLVSPFIEKWPDR